MGKSTRLCLIPRIGLSELEEGKRYILSIPFSVANTHTCVGRVCPGKGLALRTTYLVVACVLSVFDIELAQDEDGNPRIPKIEFDGASVRYVFLGPSVHTVVGVDCLVTSRQGSQPLRMHYQTPFRGCHKASEGNSRQSKLLSGRKLVHRYLCTRPISISTTTPNDKMGSCSIARAGN